MINIFNAFPKELLFGIFLIPILTNCILLTYLIVKVFHRDFTVLQKGKYAWGASFGLLFLYIVLNGILIEFKIIFLFATLVIISLDYLAFRIMKDAGDKK